MMIDRRSDIIMELEKGLNETVAIFSSLTTEALGTKVYQDGAHWTVIQVLAHFITIERTMHWLFKDILAGGPGSPDDFDVDRFNRTQPRKLDGHSVDDLIEQFKSVRQETISIVRNMTEADLDREGNHAFHGRGRLERFVRWAYEHVRIHEKDIQNLLEMS